VVDLQGMSARTLSLLPAVVALVSLASLAPAETSPARPDSSAFLSVQQVRGGHGLVPDPAVLRQQVPEPLFAFVFLQVEADSLGTWTAEDLLAFAADWGQPSAFPVAEHLVSLSREALDTGEQLEHRGLRCTRRWVVELRPALAEFPLPFSILGYHPGKLSVSTPLVLNEWWLGERTVEVTVEGETRRYLAEGITLWQLAEGWLILDVDGWLDKLLGRAADDAANEAFVAAWVEGEIVGVGNSVGRKGRRIYGEFDFREGEIENHGRPLARGLASEGRDWCRIGGGDPRETWRAYDER
jgi:hypothetical protein